MARQARRGTVRLGEVRSGVAGMARSDLVGHRFAALAWQGRVWFDEIGRGMEWQGRCGVDRLGSVR